MSAPLPGRSRPAAPDDAVAGLAPPLVVEPADEGEAVALLREAAARKLRLVFAGGGTDLGLGNPPSGLDALVRTGRMARILEHAPQDQIVRVEAGIPIEALQAQLAAHGQRLALDPPFPERATAGGVLCGNGFGPLRTSRGSARDLVIGVSLVRADGVLAKGGGKVVKNVAGFDIPRVLFGSLGTLALVTSVTFRLHPLPEARTTLRFGGLSAARVRDLVCTVVAGQLEPAAVAAVASGELFDLAVRFEGFGPGVAGQVERLLALARAAGLAGEPAEGAEASALWARHDQARARGPLRVRLAAPPAAPELPAALSTLGRALADPAAAWYPTLGLAFAGGAPTSPQAAASAAADARGTLAKVGGWLAVQDAPAALRALADTWGPAPAALLLHRRLKAQLDPEGRLAPGRLPGGL